MKRAAVCALLAMLVCVACAPTRASSAHGDVSAIAQSAPEYRLGPGDKVRVTVFGQEGLTGEYLVSARGDISYPLIGNVAVAGKTLGEITDGIAAALRQGYVNNPNVSAEVISYRPFYVLGEVNDPGSYAFSPDLTVMSAVATAGGFTYRANSRHVFIRHAGQTAEQRYPATNATVIQPGDVVRVGERWF